MINRVKAWILSIVRAGKISTDYGDGKIKWVKKSLLKKVEGGFENDHELTTWVEYYDSNLLVHRSAHVRLKHGIALNLETGALNG